MAESNQQVELTPGVIVKVLEYGKKVIDRCIVCSCIKYDTDQSIPKIQIKSIELSPGKIKTLVFFKEGWRMLFEDPMTRTTCFSKRGYWFILESE